MASVKASKDKRKIDDFGTLDFNSINFEDLD